MLAAEWLRGSATLETSARWPLIQAGVAGAALLVAWRRRDKLRLIPILLLGLAFQLAWIGVHLHLGVQGDADPTYVYPMEGHALLHGSYPKSEYPPGAVALFTLETWVGGGAARIPNAFVMIPFQLLCVASIWALRTRWSGFWATFVAFWPLNAFFWEFRFDLIPAAALVVGLVLASRGRWYEGGLVLGSGAIVKWTPVLSAAVLVLWLIWSGRRRLAGVHVLGFAIPVLLANVPLLFWKKSELLAAYTTQNARTITAESFPYLPLRLFGLAKPNYWYFQGAFVPSWSNHAATAFQGLAVLAVIALAVFVRNQSSAIALASMAPVVFFLTNRIFSPQFFVLIVAAWAVAASLVIRTRWEALLVAALCATATVGNTVLYQALLGARPVGAVPGWTFVSVAAFLPGLAATGWLIGRALQRQSESLRT